MSTKNETAPTVGQQRLVRHISREDRMPHSRESVGMKWWNGLTRAERVEMFRRAKDATGIECSPAQVFDLWERRIINMPNTEHRRSSAESGNDL